MFSSHLHKVRHPPLVGSLQSYSERFASDAPELVAEFRLSCAAPQHFQIFQIPDDLRNPDAFPPED